MTTTIVEKGVRILLDILVTFLWGFVLGVACWMGIRWSQKWEAKHNASKQSQGKETDSCPAESGKPHLV